MLKNAAKGLHVYKSGIHALGCLFYHRKSNIMHLMHRKNLIDSKLYNTLLNMFTKDKTRANIILV